MWLVFFWFILVYCLLVMLYLRGIHYIPHTYRIATERVYHFIFVCISRYARHVHNSIFACFFFVLSVWPIKYFFFMENKSGKYMQKNTFRIICQFGTKMGFGFSTSFVIHFPHEANLRRSMNTLHNIVGRQNIARYL